VKVYRSTSNRRAIEFTPTMASSLVSAAKIVGFQAPGIHSQEPYRKRLRRANIHTYIVK
jgi:hypothetical protein